MIKALKYILIFSLVFASCKSKKNLTDSKTIKNLSTKRVVKNHYSADFDKKTIDAKLKVNYKNNKSDVDFSVRMKIKKDEVIWLKGSKFITVFRAKITPEKISYYSPHFKHYFEEDFSEIQKILGVEVTFKQLQNIFLGQVLFNIKQDRNKVEISNNSYKIEKNMNLFDAIFFINPSHFKLDKQKLVNIVKNQYLKVEYPEYMLKDDALFPEKINIVTKSINKFTEVDINVNSVIFDSKLNMPFSIPEGYEEIEL